MTSAGADGGLCARAIFQTITSHTSVCLPNRNVLSMQPTVSHLCVKEFNMIHQGKLHLLIKNVKEHGISKCRPFSIKWVNKQGEICEANDIICTSWHSKGCTLNIKFLDSGEIRKVNRFTIIEYNGTEVFK